MAITWSVIGSFLAGFLAWRYVRRAARRATLPDDLSTLAVLVSRGTGMWAARQAGECCTCGHEWIPGEIIGYVTQAYVRTGERRPGTRLACCVCVERQRLQGDLSLEWKTEGLR